ncbi:MAG TPA: DoxX family protein [Candidatus Eisenbacteria bacterium]|jgi:putative oxidoreductase|nr:DoxX family protein [Candidatus Eisenbacteria bacterium]
MASYGALLLRLILGVVYVMHAYLALVVLGPSGMIGYQAKAGVPFPEIATWYLILAHGLGGILLVLGIYTRWAALVNLPAMLGALVFVHLKKGFWAFDGGYEYVLVLLVATLAAAMIGGGALSLKR